MDGWSPADWACLPEEPFHFLAAMYDTIEDGASWPADVLHARAAYLAKSDEPSLEPLDYRILLIFVLLYRRYCMVRLINLRPWVLKWQMPEMFAGVPGVGAEDAWWLTAILLEHCKLHNCIFRVCVLTS